ncbi:hypothetical protein OSTOST_15810 [Ostertagia ostertagi]
MKRFTCDTSVSTVSVYTGKFYELGSMKFAQCRRFAGDQSVDSRNIGTEHWPLKLNVQFYESSPEDYYAKACILTERTGQVTCFPEFHIYKAALNGMICRHRYQCFY